MKNTFANATEHRAWLVKNGTLPAGFRVGTTQFHFTPREAPKPAKMTLTLIALDTPTPDFAAVFTRSAFPGAPVIIGRQILNSPTLGAILINNKISNVCAPNGIETAEKICEKLAEILHLKRGQILPSSTGVIGWELPAEALVSALPRVAAALDGTSILPAAEGIVTTDLYPKIRGKKVGNGTVVAIGKGAGMIEPNLATMLVYILTDLQIPRETLRTMLSRAVNDTFNCISIDADMSTSDTVALVSSGKIPCNDIAEFEGALREICRDLAEDIVRNGEGVRHVIRVKISGAKNNDTARALGKAIVNAPLFKCAVAGNDPNVGRLVQAIGKFVGNEAPDTDVSCLRIGIGGMEIFSNGTFQLNPEKENALVAHLKDAELYASAPDEKGNFKPAVNFPPHERCVEIEISLGNGTGGNGTATILGGDLTHEYVTENADYRS